MQWKSDAREAREDWQRHFSNAEIASAGQADHAAIHQAGCALEAAELLLFTHGRRATADLQRFSDASALLCRLLLRIDQPRLACSVIGGTVASLQELRAQGVQPALALSHCQCLITAIDPVKAAGTVPGFAFARPVSASTPAVAATK
ncbi:MAG: hypothetical protein KDI01_10110 [Halioglobus sp.]|nr:hypothetical protein [Halioglobus sp.]